MEGPSPTTTSRRSPLSTLSSVLGEVCRSSSRPSLARPSPLRSSPPTPSRTSKPRSRTRRASPQTSRGRSSLASSLRTEGPSRTTTSRRSPPSTSSSVLGEVCRSSSRPSLARPSPLRSSPPTPSRTSRPRSGQGGHPPGPAEVDLRWQAARGRKDPLRLQHPEGVHSPPCPPSQGRYADLRQDPDWQDHHP